MPKAGRPPGHRAADPAHTHDAEGLAPQVHAEKEIGLPTLEPPAPHEAVARHTVPGNGQEKGPRGIRRRLGENIGRVGHDHAVLFGRFEIYVVRAHGAVGHHIQDGTCLEHFRRDPVRGQGHGAGRTLEPPAQHVLRQRFGMLEHPDPDTPVQEISQIGGQGRGQDDQRQLLVFHFRAHGRLPCKWAGDRQEGVLTIVSTRSAPLCSRAGRRECRS